MAASAARRDGRPTRDAAILALMAAAHGAVLLAMLWSLGERWREAEPRAVDVELLRPSRAELRPPPQRIRSSRQTPSRLARPPQTPPPEPVQPPAPTAPANTPAVQAGLAAVLRRTLGCPQADLLHLSRAERARCDQRFAAGGRDPAPLPIGVSPMKQAAFAAGSWRNREPILARTPHNGCEPNVSEHEVAEQTFAPHGVGKQDWRVSVGCAVDLDRVGRALRLRR